ncbi:hypothetical protein [Natrononativus amylolyticus]|uniref:hypothetical protein n=1 Tax=Natrononativus amylolyticus TaxID=2963434 RepID=UPI0020CD045B|nr:hypothetical protein [Natrononativus amylolyticus]
MSRFRRALALLALGGWFGAIVSHLTAGRAGTDAQHSRWAVRRNQFLLLSSICTNTLALTAAYRYVRAFRARVE